MSRTKRRVRAFVVGVALTAALGATSLRADDPKNAEEANVPAKKQAPKVEAAPAIEAKQVLEVFDAFGAVADFVAGQVAAEIAVDPFEQQFTPQFRKLLKTELNFVQSVCRPNAAQYQTIKTAGNLGLRNTVKKFADIQKKMQQGVRAGQEPEWPDPRKQMSDVLLRSVKATLSAEAAKRYEAELEKRAAARKRAALLNLVAKLDKDLVLTAEQREKLTDALNSNWKDAWCQQLETFMYGDAYFPVVPDAQVVPVLSEKQKQIWNGLPKHHNMIWGWAGFGFVQAVDVEEAIVVEEAVEARAVEDKSEEPKQGEGKKGPQP